MRTRFNYIMFLSFIPLVLGSQDHNKQNDFDVDLSYVADTDSTIKVLTNIINVSDEEILISLSENPYINKGDDILISTSYKHISDPLSMPKLGMPWKLLNPGDTIRFTDYIECVKIREATIFFDYLFMDAYPYKKLKSKTRREYWFTRVKVFKDAEVIYISLGDYYLMYEKEGSIRTIYEKVCLEEIMEDKVK